jgi:hypothetical protein
MGETRPATGKAQVQKIVDDGKGYTIEYSMKLYWDGSFLIQCNLLDTNNKRQDIIQVVGGLVYAKNEYATRYLDVQTRAGRLSAWLDDQPKESDDKFKITMCTLWYQVEYTHPNGAVLYATSDLVSSIQPNVIPDRDLKLYVERNIPEAMKELIETLDVRQLTKT